MNQPTEKTGLQILNFHMIRPESKFGLAKLSNGSLVFYFDRDPEEPELGYAGIAVKDAMVCANVAKAFAEMAEALLAKESETTTTPAIVQ